MMFCGFCGNSQEQKNQIQVRDPTDIYKNLKVNQRNTKQLIQAISKLGNFNTIIPSQFQTYLKDCQQSKKKFVDKQFPPNDKSLNFFTNNRRIQWKRISEVVSQPVMVEGGINPSDVQQGNLGDCYFLASIASLANQPQRIKRIFCNQMEIRPEGIYRLQLSISGQYRQVVIDDFIPVFQGSKRPVFCKAYNNEVWVMLLEKAWAKLNGSYGATSAGHPHEVLNTFSVAPCYYYQLSNFILKNQDEKLKIWKFLQQATTYKLPVCAGSRQSYTCKGIKPAHTYSVLRVATISINTNQTVNLLTLRNPWGDTQYMGRYSQYDTQFWSKVGQINKSKVKKQNDGVFTIQYDEFLRNFQSLDICHDRPDYSNLFRKIQVKSSKPVFFQIQILQSSLHNFYITVQKTIDRNMYIKNRKQYFGYLRLVVARKRTQIVNNAIYETYQYITSALQTNFPDLSYKLDKIQPGTYVIMIQTQFPSQKQGQLCLYLYSKQTILNISGVQLQNNNFLSRVFTSHANSFIPRSQRTLLSESPNDWTASQFLFKQGGYGYIIISLGSQTTQQIQLILNSQKIQSSGFVILESNYKLESETINLNKNDQIIVVFGLNFQTNIKTVTFPPKGIKISKII